MDIQKLLAMANIKDETHGMSDIKKIGTTPNLQGYESTMMNDEDAHNQYQTHGKY